MMLLRERGFPRRASCGVATWVWGQAPVRGEGNHGSLTAVPGFENRIRWEEGGWSEALGLALLSWRRILVA